MNELKQAMAKVIMDLGWGLTGLQSARIAQAILDMPEIKQALQNTVALSRGETMGDEYYCEYTLEELRAIAWAMESSKHRDVECEIPPGTKRIAIEMCGFEIDGD